MKKNFSVIFVFLICVLTLNMFFGFNKSKVFAEEMIDGINSKSALLIDADSNTVIYQKDSDLKAPIASMCKVMTLVLCFDKISNNEIDFTDMVTVSKNASGMGGSQVFLEENAEYSVGELIKSIVVASANDACVAMAERLYGSEESFVEKMNEKAKALNMTSTNFVNCTGLPKAGQYSTAKDVAKMFLALISNKDYFRFSKIWTDIIKHPKDRITEISNTNKLIKFYNGCNGGKTGYTSEAGHCIVACANKGNLRLISVVISAPDSKTRFSYASKMFNYGFNNYTNKLVVDDQNPLNLEIKIHNGKSDKLEVIAKQSFYLLSKKGENRSVEIDFVPYKKVVAPIIKGDLVGELKIFEKGVLIGTVKIVANENVSQKTYFDYIGDIAKNWKLV